MDYLRGKNKIDTNNGEDIEIQIVGWHNYDDHELDEDLMGEDNNFNVLITGIDSLKRSVAVYVENFKPFFFIRIPNDWKKSHVSILAEACKKHYMIDEMYCEDLEKFSIVKRKPFYGYTHDDMFKFAKLVFRNKGAFHAYQNIFRRPLRVRDLFGGQQHYYELFESSVEPMLRMMHVRDIQASGWIRICAKDYHVNKPSLSNCQYDITVPYKKIVGIKKDSVGDIVFAGFDIEADSSHGDFPIANKDYKKLARDIFNEYINLFNAKNSSIQRHILEYILLAFEDCFNQNEIDYIGLSDVPDNLMECADAILCDDFVGVDNKLKKYFKLEKEVCKRFATQIVSEHKRLLFINDKVYLHKKRETLAFILGLAFNPFYNAANVNVVYTKGNAKPGRETIQTVSREVYRLCSLYTENMKKKKRLNAGKKNLVSRKEKDALREELSGDDYDLSHYIELINTVMNEQFPAVQGDNLIQIGTTFQKLGEPDCFLKHIIVLDTCDNISNDELVRDENKDTEFPLEELEKHIKQHGLEEFSLENVEDIGGYLKSCSKEEKGRLNDHLIKLNYLRQAETDKADVVVEVYHNMKDVLLAWTRLIVLSDVDVIVGYNIFGFDFKFMYECAQVCDCVEEFMQIGRMKGLVQKMHVQGHNIKDTNKKQSQDDMAHNIEMHGRLVIDLFKVIQTSYNLDSYKLDSVCEKFLYKNKNDLPPKEIFRLQKGDSEDRCTIAKYCIIDCVLCNRLLIKLQILMNNIGMSNVCSVPLMYLFLRGQGIKGLSFVSKICRNKGYLINTLKKQEETSEKYEGAIVLKPTTKIYIEDPVCVADFNSLYPSCMISENLSHDSLAGVYNCYKCIDIDKLEAVGKRCECYKFVSKYAHIGGVEYVDIQYDIYDYIDDYNSQGMVKKEKKKIKSGIKTCRFAQLPDGKKSIIPEILQELLKQRKNTRKTQKNFPENSFEWNIYEGLQLAYKITANSIYGLTGAQTSKIYLPEIAASTTATGRNLIKFTKKHYESHYDCKVVYGDTDSVFIRFNCKDIHGKKLRGLDAINKSIMYCTEGALEISRQLKRPHNLEFEKAIFPFILISKKRYHGHYYTSYGSSSYAPKSMGIVLKRRDNANICKEIFGGAIREIMVKQDLEASLQMVKSCLRKLLDGEYPYDMFVISKTLRSYYKNPDSVAHNVLARRIARRDPGNKPQTNDRVPYIYVQVPGDDGKKKILQGDRVENPDYAHVMKLKMDYKFYLERQVMQPILQVFKLDPMYYERCKRLFDDTLMEYELKRTKSQKITDFFKVIPKKEKDTRKKTIIIKRDTLKMDEGGDGDDEDNEVDDVWGDGIADNDLVDLASYEF
ncbi:hypothetical protein N9064_00320 [bacterium]|nr:hypothetical protein [bacterium]